MTCTQSEGLVSLVLARYAGNLHIINHADVMAASSLVHRAQLENSVIDGLALDHFPLKEALEQVREFVEGASDFPP